MGARSTRDCQALRPAGGVGRRAGIGAGFNGEKQKECPPLDVFSHELAKLTQADKNVCSTNSISVFRQWRGARQQREQVPHALLLEVFTDSGVGTMVVPQ